MSDEDELIDQEEFEHLLYNQVYHSFDDTEPVTDIPKPSNDMNSAGRYFHNKATERQSSNISNLNAYNYTLDPQAHLYNLQSRGFSLPHMLVSPINNIVVLPNPPTQVFFNNKEQKRNKRNRKKKKKKLFEANQKAAANNANKTELLKPTQESAVEVITVSDSDSSDVCCIDAKPPLISLSSDDEVKSKTETKEIKSPDPSDNDVIFVPTPKKKIETVVIDEETVPKLKECASTPINQSPEHIPSAKELLGTPESTNDFLESAAETMQTKFNFGLHGADFNAKDLSRQPNKPVGEKCETESSASDVSTPMKTAVFNEVAFESPAKNIFSESSLKTFADFIVPKRLQSTPAPASVEKRSSGPCRKISASSSSDSSSESDYEEASVGRKKRLPSLSLFEESTLKMGEDETDLKRNADSEENRATTSFKVESAHVACSVSSSDDDDEGEPYMVCPSDSDGSMDDEESKEDVSMIHSSGSDESSLFEMNELEAVEDDLEIINCEETVQKSHEPRDVNVKKEQYSFDAIWSEDKEKFYLESWGHEDFSITQVQKTMSDDPDKWKILDADRERTVTSPAKRMRCRKCRDRHYTHLCPRRGVQKCSLCGFRGHSEPRCPNKICTMCGRPNNYTTTYCFMCQKERFYNCRLCKMQGHIESRCPDLWRRYFLTTKEGPVIRPEGPEIKEASQLCCSGCAKFGHLEHDCPYFNRSHPPTRPLVCRYEDIYGMESEKKTVAVPAQNSKPNDNFNFYESYMKYKGKTTQASPEKQKDLVDLKQDRRQKFSFLAAAVQYCTTTSQPPTKKSNLLPNPFVSYTHQQPAAPHPPETQFPPETSVVFNGFEPDLTTPLPRAVLPSSVGSMLAFLYNAFAKIRACKSADATKLWNQLKKLEEAFDKRPFEMTLHKIRMQYERLHTVLFGVHRFLEGVDALKVLRRWQKSLEVQHRSSLVPKLAVDEIAEAYYYVFGGSRKDLNYVHLLSKLREKMQKIQYTKEEIDRDYDFFKQNCNGTDFKKLHSLYRKIKAGKGVNESSDIVKFRASYKAFRMSLFRSKANHSRENV